MSLNRLYGLVGSSLPHSKSPILNRKFFQKSGQISNRYELFELESIDRIPDLLRNPDLYGFNVTIPYKESILGYLDEIDSEAKAVGAVNTVVKEGSKWKGYNTDIFGFSKSLDILGLHSPKQALILGSGGASQAVQYALRKRACKVEVVSRKRRPGFIRYSEIDEKVVAPSQLIVNTTPIGKFPDHEIMPYFPYHLLRKDHIVMDLNYNPPVNAFIRRVWTENARAMNGSIMLKEQAKKSWQIWKSHQ